MTSDVDNCSHQYTGWYDEPSVDGIEGSVSKMMGADPDFGKS